MTGSSDREGGLDRFDIAIVGAGPAGLAAALALAHVAQGTATTLCLIGPPPAPQNVPGQDTRTAALMESSVQLLRRLGVWEQLQPHASPLKAIRIVDDVGKLKAPEVIFRASELGLEAFGFNTPNTLLVETLYAEAQKRISVLSASVTAIAKAGDHLDLTLSNGGAIAARLVVGADGRRSLSREMAGIAVREWSYPQSAIATRFRHSLAHANVSTEFHRKAGPLTTVPLPDPKASSLIWVAGAEETQALMALEPAAFGRALAGHLSPITGSIDEVGPRAAFPVSGMVAKDLTGYRTALVGEAAHILPPIGAQGLNLGFRDAAWLAERLQPCLGQGGDPGADSTLRGYAQSRSLDVMTRTIGVDLLNRSLVTGFAPAQAARGAVLFGLKTIPALRRLAMRAGLAPPNALPSLMRSAP